MIREAQTLDLPQKEKKQSESNPRTNFDSNLKSYVPHRQFDFVNLL